MPPIQAKQCTCKDSSTNHYHIVHIRRFDDKWGSYRRMNLLKFLMSAEKLSNKKLAMRKLDYYANNPRAAKETTLYHRGTPGIGPTLLSCTFGARTKN